MSDVGQLKVKTNSLSESDALSDYLDTGSKTFYLFNCNSRILKFSYHWNFNRICLLSSTKHAISTLVMPFCTFGT